MNSHATGTFEIQLTPAREGDQADGSTLARLTFDKQFHGGIEGNSKGEMLSATTAVSGSAGYVAIERVTGMLEGRGGSFVLQHTGIMNRGVPDLTVSVVPDSGSGQLVGLTGRLSIKIAEGQHSYDFEYSLPEAG
jgi:hypothetical protein